MFYCVIPQIIPKCFRQQTISTEYKYIEYIDTVGVYGIWHILVAQHL